MNGYLQHYGILGMKWGVRRYQNEDGTLTEAGKRRYVNKRSYDYKISGSYKNASKGEKAKMTTRHNENRQRFHDEGTANKIDYEINELGYSESKATRRAIARYIGAEVASVATIWAINNGKAWYDMKRAEVELNNIGVQEYARQAGIPVDEETKGFSTGFKQAKRGRKFYNLYNEKYKS